MPRTGRIVAPDMPHHIVQRGHNRNIVFVEDGDYLYYLDNLREWSSNLGVKLYAWCLMTNHVHLLLNPGDCTESIGLLMKRLAGRQTRYVNKQEGRTGSLWEGRYKLSIVDSSEYFLVCCRYIELNPVKAGIVDHPAAYRWSSFVENTDISGAGIVDRAAFSEISAMHAHQYRDFVLEGEKECDRRFISERVESNRLTGSTKFVDEIETRTGIRIEYRKPGRPRTEK